MEFPPLSSAPLKKTPEEKADEELNFNFLQRQQFTWIYIRCLLFFRVQTLVCMTHRLKDWLNDKLKKSFLIQAQTFQRLNVVVCYLFYLARDSFDPVKNSPGGSMIVKSTFFRDIFQLHTKPFEQDKYFLIKVLSRSSDHVFFPFLIRCCFSVTVFTCHFQSMDW